MKIAIGVLAGALALSSVTHAAEPTASVAVPEPVASGCELHVFPTENYIGINLGLLTGFGVVGVLADMEAHKGRVATVKDLMKSYLGPELQISELEKLDYVKRLGLEGYTVIIEPPTPSSDDVKADPALKAKVKALNADLKAGKRLTGSTSPCYAEFMITSIFYHKAMMYGSNLFVGTILRDYGRGRTSPVQSLGAVKNPLEVFPPKSAEMVDAAKAELRDAFAKDFLEWTDKKLVKSAPPPSQ